MPPLKGFIMDFIDWLMVWFTSDELLLVLGVFFVIAGIVSMGSDNEDND